jgi:hypothetical protein
MRAAPKYPAQDKQLGRAALSSAARSDFKKLDEKNYELKIS